MVMMVLAGQSVWAADGDFSTNQLQIGALDAQYQAVAPGWKSFTIPTVRVYHRTDGQDVVETNRYVLTYVIDGMNSTNVTVDPETKRNITTDPNTNTKVDYNYGTVTVGNKTADGQDETTVTVKIVATPKPAYSSLTTLEGTYSFNIRKQTPAVSLSATPLAIPTFHTVGSNVVGETTFYHFSNTSEKVTVPTATATVTSGSYTQDMTEAFNVTYSVQSGTIELVDDNTAIKATFEEGQDKGQNCTDESQIPNPYNAGGSATLLVTLTPKTEYANAYTEVTREVPVTIFVINDENKLSVDFTIDVPDGGFHWSRYNENKFTENDRTIHQLPRPKVTASNGNDLSNNGDFSVIYFAVDDQTYKDYCQMNEINVGQKATLLSSGTIWEAGNPTKGGISGTNFVYGFLNQNDAAFRYTSNKAGHLKIGMFIYATSASNVNIAKLYKYQDDNIINSSVTSAANIINNESTTIPWGLNPQTWTGDNFRRVSPVKFFDIDVMHRTPVLKLDPDPTDITVSTSDTITFNNRFELTGSIDDRNDGSAGNLIFGAPDANSDHFSYSFEFSKDAGIKVLNWPHGEYVFALNSEGNIIEPITRDAAGLPVYKVFETKKEIYYPAGKDVNPYWYEYRDVPTTTVAKFTAEEAEAYNKKAGTSFVAGNPKDVTSLISTYKYFSVKGYNTDKSWAMIFTKDGGYDVKYTIYPYNHVRWDVSSTITKHYTVQVGKTPVLKIDPKELVATVNQAGFVEPDVWVEDAYGTEVTQDFKFKYVVSSDGGTGTTIGSPTSDTYGELGKPDHEVNIGSTAGVVTVTVTANTENVNYSTKTISDTYVIHVLDNPAGSALYEIISSHDDNVTGYVSGGKDNIDSNGMPKASGTTDNFAAAEHTKMGKMHFISEGDIYAGYTISGIPGLEVRLGSFDGSLWQVRGDTSDESGSYDNDKDETNGLHNKFIGDSAPVVLNEDGIATGGSFYEFFAHTNGYLIIDGRWEKDKEYVLIDYDYPSEVQKYVNKEETKKGECPEKTFKLIEDHSYHLYCVDGGLNMHGLRFEPIFLNPANHQQVTKATSFQNGFGNIPLITDANRTMEYDSYTSDNTTYAEVGARNGKVTAKELTYNAPDHKVTIRSFVKSNIKSPKGNPIYKWPKYDLVIGDIPTYRLGDQKRKSETYSWANDGLKKDGFVESGEGTDAKGTIYVPVPGDTVSTYNILTPIRMTYGGWQNQYKYKAIGVDGNVIKSKVAGKTDQDSIVTRLDEYQAKTNAEVAGLTDTDTQFNKYIDNFTWSNVAKQNPSDENNSQNYRNYITDPAYMPADGQKSDDYLYGINGVSQDNKRGFYKNTFTLPAHGAYWRFEPRVSGTLFVYLVQNGLCSYTGNPSLLGSNSKNYELLDWKPLYIVDETGQNVSTDIDLGNGAISSFIKESGAYTEGLLRCDKNDSYIRQITKTDPDSETSDFTFLWENGKTGNDAKGFSIDYRGEASNLESLKTKIMEKWTGAGDVEQVVTDVESGGHILISKSYVRYAVNVKAGKSYWVFQHGSKPNFCGFAFVPTGYPETMGETPIDVTIDDTHSLDESLTTDNNGNIRNAEDVYDKTCNVTYSGRTFYNNRWTSLCLPFAVSEYNFKKVFGENAKIVTFDQITKDLSYIHFTMHNYHMMEAGRPYFVCPAFDDNSESKTNLTFEGVTIEKIGDGYIPAASDATVLAQKQRIIKDPNGSVFQFVGTYNGESINKYSYFLNGNTGALTRNVWDGLSCGHYRAYLKNSTSDVNQARLLSTTYNEPYEDKPEPSVPTTIVGVPDGGVMEMIGSESAKGIYTIDGKKLSASAKDRATLPAGIYIIDGKKQVVK